MRAGTGVGSGVGVAVGSDVGVGSAVGVGAAGVAVGSAVAATVGAGWTSSGSPESESEHAEDTNASAVNAASSRPRQANMTEATIEPGGAAAGSPTRRVDEGPGRLPAMAPRIWEWIDSHDDEENPLIPAATVILLRDASAGLETLMLRRNSKLSFAEGMWVFPGGKIDAEDHDDAEDAHAAAMNAAVREAKEEGDLSIDLGGLVYYSHWLPPVQSPKRFSTWFFVAPAPDGDVTVDQGEITDHAWWNPGEALERAHDRRIEILPPTWMTLNDLAQYGSVDECLARTAERGPQAFATKIVRTPDGPAATWEEDAAYHNGEHDTPGQRHRLVMMDGPWRLERSLGD